MKPSWFERPANWIYNFLTVGIRREEIAGRKGNGFEYIWKEIKYYMNKLKNDTKYLAYNYLKTIDPIR
jgi:hypothetical protein